MMKRLILFLLLSVACVDAQGQLGFFRSPPVAVSGGGGSYYLDQTGLGTAYLAVSVVRLSSSYSGALMRVRRASDNAEVDVSPDGSSTPQVSLTSVVSAGGDLGTWASSTNVYVTKWYDQSGNSRDLIQATAAKQPHIITNGVLFARNSIASLESVGNNCNLQAAIGSSSHPYTVDLIAGFNSVVTANRLFGSQGGNVLAGAQSSLVTWAAASQITASYVATTLTEFIFLANGASSTIYTNNVSAVTGNTGNNVMNTAFVTFNSVGETQPLLGGIQQIVFWAADTTGARTTSYNYNKTIFGLP